MIYTVIANGQSYDLQAKTIAVMERLDEVLTIDSKPLTLRQKYQKLFDFVKWIIGPEIKEILGGDKITDIDVGELELLILKIQDAYNAPVTEYRTGKLEENLESIPADKLAAITEAAKAISNVEKLK